MRALGLVLLAIGLIGLILGLLDALGMPLTGAMMGHATWGGVGPIIAGLGLVGLGAYFALRRV